MLLFLKAIPAFLQTWRLYIVTGICVAAGLAVFNYVDNHGEMKAQIVSQNALLQQCESNENAWLSDIANLNATITRMNARELAELEDVRVRLQTAYEAAEALRSTSAELMQELAVTRFELLEEMQDDEEFYDWANEPVPTAAWGLLQQSAESGAD